MMALAADPDALRGLGARLAELLRPGDVVVLSGPLGAGKTVFAQGVAAGLGVPDPVTSPTFVLARVHRRGPVPFVHVDAYRLRGAGNADAALLLDDLDLDADLDEAVTVVEWGEGLAERLAESRVEVGIRRRPDDVREVTVTGTGPRWAGVDLSGR